MERFGRHIASVGRALKCSWRTSHPSSSRSEFCNSTFPWRRAFNAIRPVGLGFTRALHLTLQGTALTNGIRTVHPTILRSGQQCRQIRVRVRNGNLEQALLIMQRKMIASGMERLIKRVTPYHIKASEKRILARKRRESRQRSEELAKKLRSILIRKVRGF